MQQGFSGCAWQRMPSVGIFQEYDPARRLAAHIPGICLFIYPVPARNSPRLWANLRAQSKQHHPALVTAEPPALPRSAQGIFAHPARCSSANSSELGAPEHSHLAGSCRRCSSSPPGWVQGQRLPEQQICTGISAVSSSGESRGAAEEQKEHKTGRKAVRHKQGLAARRSRVCRRSFLLSSS